jgi:hypothetical protein
MSFGHGVTASARRERQDADGDEQIPQVVHRRVRGHQLEGGTGDLDLALAIARRMQGPVERLNQ